MLPVKHIMNSALANTEHGCEFFLVKLASLVKRPDLGSISVRERRSHMALPEQTEASFWTWTSSFAAHVLKIVFLGPLKKMPWIAARRIVAGVADKQSGPHLSSVMKFKCQSVRPEFVFFNTKSAVLPFTIWKKPTPLPAFIRPFFIYPCPESVRHWELANKLHHLFRDSHWFKSYCGSIFGQARLT